MLRVLVLPIHEILVPVNELLLSFVNVGPIGFEYDLIASVANVILKDEDSGFIHSLVEHEAMHLYFNQCGRHQIHSNDLREMQRAARMVSDYLAPQVRRYGLKRYMDLRIAYCSGTQLGFCYKE